MSGTIKFRYRTIDFPNLGIHLKSVGDHITVFGFDIAYYGIVIGIGILAGLMMAVMDYITVFEDGRLQIKFYDGTEFEVETE